MEEEVLAVMLGQGIVIPGGLTMMVMPRDWLRVKERTPQCLQPEFISM
jgi:hypothetical protein